MTVAASDWVELVRAIPAILWVVLAGCVLFLFRQPIAERISVMRSVELPGGIRAQFDAAISTAAELRGDPLGGDVRSRLERRIARNAELLRGAELLWADDDHASTRYERAALTATGAIVETVASTTEALERLRVSSFDVVISDMVRGDDATAGAELVTKVRQLRDGVPTILYVGHADPTLGTPPYAFGIADRPATLMHLVIDALERGRG